MCDASADSRALLTASSAPRVSRVQTVYSSLPNFEEKEEDFRAESVLLRRRFTDESMFSCPRASLSLL